MGIGYDVDIYGQTESFDQNCITDFACFDQRNLFMCTHLNLRGSSFEQFKIKHLQSLEYLDISLCKAKTLDVRACKALKEIVVDHI